MEQNVTPTWGPSTVDSTYGTNITTNTTSMDWSPDEVNAAVFIVVVIGFFAFIIITSLVINQLYSEPEEEDVLETYLNIKPTKINYSLKPQQEFLPSYNNQAYHEEDLNIHGGHHEAQVIKSLKIQDQHSAGGPAFASEQDTVTTIATVF